MKNPTRAALTAAVAALLAVACSQDAAPPASAPAQSEPTAPAAPVASTASPQLQSITVDQIDEARMDAPASCNIETIDEVPLAAEPLTIARNVAIKGWFLSEISKSTGSPASIRFVNDAGDAGWDVSVGNWQARPDVLAAMQAVDGGNAGFTESVDLSSLPAGKYDVSVVFAAGDVKYSCDKRWSLVLE